LSFLPVHVDLLYPGQTLPLLPAARLRVVQSKQVGVVERTVPLSLYRPLQLIVDPRLPLDPPRLLLQTSELGLLHVDDLLLASQLSLLLLFSPNAELVLLRLLGHAGLGSFFFGPEVSCRAVSALLGKFD
jgi:hypothetical protein